VDWEAVDPLYDRRPEEFVAARNALAKELRAAGDRAAAAAVAKLRRPTTTAYALNQLARHRPEVLAAALATREDLRAATEGAGRGGPGGLREATLADREATRAVVAAAREVLGSDDPALPQRITGTLLAGVLDDEVGAALRAGRLTAEQDASALVFAGGDGGGSSSPVVSLADHAATRRRDGRAARGQRGEEAERAAARADAEAADRARRRERVEREQAVGRLERRVARLQGKVAEVEDELAAARDELAAAHRELGEARAAVAEPTED
jgi:hypothetical protein